MFNKILFIVIIFYSLANTGVQFAQAETNQFRFRGYIKSMPYLQFSGISNEVYFNNLIHNRINFAWFANNSLTFAIEGRNRVFAGETIKNYPLLIQFLERDQGYADLSKVWVSGNSWALHTIIDRLYIDFKTGNWQVRAGRQRINWGVTMVSNPNDLFNTYSFFDFDYTERPGSDAIRVQYFPNGMSRLEIAVNPAENANETVLAGLWALNFRGYDIQTIAGIFKNRLALGGGWAGNIGATGFKGEFTFFYDLEKEVNVSAANLVATISIDHLFSNGLFGFAEILYNGGFNRKPELIFDINQPLRADNIFLSEYAATLSFTYPFSPILNGSVALMYMPDLDAAFISPSISWSIYTNFDLQFVSQVFRGSRNSVFNEAGTALYFALNWSF